ncbi:hypothetical protein KP509_25G018700 [Ceratopteris richardii]|uniref:Uncharacterized protein n=1 Tax=Ceratopteris richardii TaxID=49495 RepID=A0A8T2RN42_CERRI|nr:hypothetical protein KP509_25G018700 [Ceratopteris richardii]
MNDALSRIDAYTLLLFFRFHCTRKEIVNNYVARMTTILETAGMRCGLAFRGCFRFLSLCLSHTAWKLECSLVNGRCYHVHAKFWRFLLSETHDYSYISDVSAGKRDYQRWIMIC